MKLCNKKGFTLLELVIVLAIMGILAAVLIPNLIGAGDNSHYSAVETIAKNVYTVADDSLDRDIEFSRETPADASAYASLLTNLVTQEYTIGVWTSSLPTSEGIYIKIAGTGTNMHIDSVCVIDESGYRVVWNGTSSSRTKV